MTDLEFQIERLKINFQKTFAAWQKMGDENKKLRQENTSLSAALAEERKKNEDLANKNLNLQLTRSFGKGTAENENLKKRLDELIKEIDNCIAHLDG